MTIRVLDGFLRVIVGDATGLLFNETLDAVDDDYRDYTINALAFPSKTAPKKQEQSEERPSLNPSPRPTS